MNKTGEQNKTRAWAILAALVLVMLAVTFVARRDMAQIKQFISSSGGWGMLATVVIYAVLGATPIPSEPLTILAATIYGPLYASLIATFGNLLSAMMAYCIGRQIGSV